MIPLVLALAAPAADPVPTAAPEDAIYTVRAGDTLIELARDYLVSERSWRDLGRLWHLADPYHLPRGRTFRVPRRWLRWTPETARVVSLRGQVQLVRAGQVLTSGTGTVLSEGARISTGANSFTTLMLTNGSRIALPSQTQVTIANLRKYAIDKAISYRFSVGRGWIDTKDTPLRTSGSRFLIDTPVAMTAVRGTEYEVAFDPEARATATSVLEGAVAVSGPHGEQPQLIRQGGGAITGAAGATTAIPLLPAPALQDPDRPQTEEQVAFSFAPVDGATGYYVQLGSDAGFLDTYAEAVSATPEVSFADVPNGNQFVRVAAIGPGDLRGMRQSYAFLRHLASIRAEVRQASDGLTFRWSGEGSGTRRYRLQVTPDRPDAVPVVDDVGLTGTEAVIRRLRPGAYVWRVGLTQTDDDGTISNWTSPEKLTVTASAGN